MSTGIPVAVAQQLQAMQAELENMRVAMKSLQEDNPEDDTFHVRASGFRAKNSLR